MFSAFRKKIRIIKPKFKLEQLEERIVLDAATPAVAMDSPDNMSNDQVENQDASTDVNTCGADQASIQESGYDGFLNVALISNALEETEKLADAVIEGAQVIVYDAYAENLSDITSRLECCLDDSSSSIGQLAIISHGDQGALVFGDNQIWTSESLASGADQWSEFSSLFSEEAIIDIYGCNIGQDAPGEAFVKNFSEITGADVRASDDVTGNVGEADWDLEIQVGISDAAMLIDITRLQGTDILLPWVGNANKQDNSIVGSGISGDLNSKAGDDTVVNSGLVDSNIDLGPGADTCLNEGTGEILGSIYGGYGNDLINNEGTVHGDLSGNEDYDTIINSNIVNGDLNGGGGHDEIVNNGDLAGSIDGGTGNDSITNSGEVVGNVFGSDGDDTIDILSGAVVQGGVTGGSGDDTITNRGYCDRIVGNQGIDQIFNFGLADTLEGGNGADYIENHGTCNYILDSATDSGNEYILNNGTVQDSIRAFDGADIIVNQGYAELIDGGAGNDAINNESGGVINDLALGEGDDSLTNYGNINGNSFGLLGCGSGDDSVFNYGAINADIDGESGKDEIYNFSEVVGNIFGHDNNDIIENTGNVSRHIYGGSGDDTIRNSGNVDWAIWGNEGNDTIHLLPGNQGDSLVNYVAGGSGNDTIHVVADSNLEVGVINGEINGGVDFDTLYLPEGCYNIVGDASLGSCLTHWGNLIEWADFEELVVDNAAPSLNTGGDISLTNISEDPTNNPGDYVYEIISSDTPNPITDNESYSKEGIAISYADNTNGQWEFFDYDTDSWSNISGVSESSALLLADWDQVRFSPNADFYGTADIEFYAWDQVYGQSGDLEDVAGYGASFNTFSADSEIATVTAEPVNDDPAINVPGSQTVDEDTSLTINGITVSDADLALAPSGNDIIKISISSQHGEISLNSLTGLSGDTDGTDGSLAFQGTLTDLNSALSSITYTPGLDFNGVDQLEIIVSDLGNYGAQGPDYQGFDLATIDITVKPVNDAPTASDNDIFMIENGTYTFSHIDFGFQDVDDGDTLQRIQITGLESVGSLKHSSTDVLLNQFFDFNDIADITYDPLPNQSGLDYDTFTFKVYDGASWSAADYTITMNVNDVNTPPTASDSIVTTDEDTPYVFIELDFGYTDPENNSFKRLQITDLEDTGELKLNGVDVTLNQEISVADINAGLLTFEPLDDESGSGYDQFSFKVSDGMDYSSSNYTMTIDVKAINDAPILAAGRFIFNPILTDPKNENQISDIKTVTEILAGRATDPDSANIGIAIYDIKSWGAGNGTWQYKPPSGSWTDFGTVSSSLALLLGPSTEIHFIGDTEDGEKSRFKFYAWDQTTGSEGDTVDVSVRGGASSFSEEFNKATITLSSQNDAPTLDSSQGNDFDTITEDDLSNSGNTVAYLLGNSITDVDANAEQGMAIIGASFGNGSWQYQFYGKTAWQDLDTGVAIDNALLLTPNDSLRFVPDGENGGTMTIEYLAWDQSGLGQNPGDYVNITQQGGQSAFSSDSDTASIIVDSVNDSPVLDNTGSMTFSAINENDFNSTGNTIAQIISSDGGDRITDVDNGAVEGIAVIGADNSNGQWQFTIDGGTSWSDLAGLSDATATLLADDPDTKIRFVPDTDFNGTIANGIKFRAWDQTSGANGQTGYAVSISETSAFSSAIETASIEIATFNSPPTSSGIPDPPPETQGFGMSIYCVANCFSDPDGPKLTYELGALTYHDGLALSGVTIYQNSGFILFKNDPNTWGSVDVQVRATDGSLYSGWQTFTFTVYPKTTAQQTPDTYNYVQFDPSESHEPFQRDDLFEYTAPESESPSLLASFFLNNGKLLGQDIEQQGPSKKVYSKADDIYLNQWESIVSKALNGTPAHTTEQVKEKTTHSFQHSNVNKDIDELLGLAAFLTKSGQWPFGVKKGDFSLSFNADGIDLATMFGSGQNSIFQGDYTQEHILSKIHNDTNPHPVSNSTAFDMDEINFMEAARAAFCETEIKKNGDQVATGKSQSFDMDLVCFADIF